MPCEPANPRRPPRRATGASAWTRLTDEELLQLRMCDLRLDLHALAARNATSSGCTSELDDRGIRFRPHVWLSEEWFSPDGVPGIAVPFYLAHPRLMRLARKMTREVEGSNVNWLMRILRHEAGHAIDSAYRLRRRAHWRALFGPASRPYRARYRARPASRHHVQHLGDWYAQSHPTEDFAETFAVWLDAALGLAAPLRVLAGAAQAAFRAAAGRRARRASSAGALSSTASSRCTSISARWRSTTAASWRAPRSPARPARRSAAAAGIHAPQLGGARADRRDAAARAQDATGALR